MKIAHHKQLNFETVLTTKQFLLTFQREVTLNRFLNQGRSPSLTLYTRSRFICSREITLNMFLSREATKPVTIICSREVTLYTFDQGRSLSLPLYTRSSICSREVTLKIFFDQGR